MTTICLIRHGETDWNCQGRLQGIEDIELNNNGRKQALDCVKYLKQNHWDAVISSPLKRAKETAKIIGDKLRMDVYEMQEFIEKDYGSASGLLPEERKLRFPDGSIHDQEDKEILTTRLMNGLNDVVNRFEGKNIIIVSHGAAINSILAALSQGEIGSGKTRLKNACINKIVFDEGRWSIKLYNHSPNEEVI